MFIRTVKVQIMAVAILLVGGSFSTAQAQLDEARMNQDLEIAENILSTLTSQGNDKSRSFYFGRSSSRSNYVEGFGVIFNIPSNDGLLIIDRDKAGETVIVERRGTGGNSYSYNITPDQKVAIAGQKGIKREILNLDSIEKASTSRTLEIMQTFIADYADLIGQLKPTDHIMVTTKKTIATNDFAFFNNRRSDVGITVEVLKSDLTSFKKGNLTREQLLAKMIITKEESSTEKVADLELLTSIFERLYKSDLSNTYYVNSRGVYYEKLKNFGVIVSMKVYSSVSDDGLYTIQTLQLDKLTREERDKKVESLYPEFERSLKDNIINYGRTVKSLQPNEKLMFKVNLTECKNCDMPKAIDLSVDASVLLDFDKSKIDLKTAVSKIKIKKYEQ